MLLLLLVTSTTAWAKDPFGYVNVCTGHQGSIYLELWALDEDDLNARTTIHVYLRQNGQDKYFYNLGATDLYRADAINPQFAGDHAMHRYLNVPVAGTYDVYVYVLNAAGGGTNPLCEHAWKGAPYPNYASVTTSSPYTVTYNANGGSGAPAATTKSYGINLTLSSTQPTRSGYLFTGWNTAADGSGTTYNSGATYTGNANLTLYAQWAQSGNNSVEMASGTHDASHWSFSSNTANFGNTITVNYSGYLNLQSVTLRRKTTNTYELNSSNISTAVSNFNSQSGSRLVFRANISEQQTFTCTEGEIDMNGHSSSKDLFIQNNVLGKTITIKNGTVTGTDGAGGFNDYYNGTVVLENMTVTGRVWTDGHPYVINGGTYAEIINDKNADTSGTVTIYDGKFSQLGNWGSGGTFTLYGGKYAINPSSLAYCTIPSGYSVQSNTDSDSSTYPWVVRNTSSPVANPYSLAVTEVTANRQWTFTMPPYDVEVVVNYAPSIPYFAYNTTTNTYEELDAPNCTAVTTATTTMGAANTETWYLVNSNVTVNNTRIEVLGTVNLILTDGKSLRAEKGIHVPPGVTLNIYGQSGGTGQLYGFSNTNYIAGIGGNSGEASGTVNIHGGTIQAWGADNSAGIGGGRNGNGGTTTIYGGSVNSTGVEGGAGIGGGYGGNGGIITIYGGDVVAKGSYKWGAGIGGGRNGNGGTISIYGGTINATGGEAAAGIGGGIAANCGIITITGGTVIAQAQTVYDGDNSQAIGSGAGTVSGGTLTINNMRVYSSANATNPVAPANNLSTCQSKYAKLMPCTHNYEDGVCTICGGIELIGTGGPGTYLAYQTATHSFVELTADNPTIVDASTTTMGAAGTETWYIADNDVTISGRIMVNGTVHLILNDGTTLTANGGIDVTEGKSLHIHSQRERTGQLTATATDGAGIGGGYGSNVGNITIHSGNITATGGAWSAGIGGGTNGGGGSITIYRGNVEGIGWREGNRGNAVGIGRGSGGAAVAIQADRLRLQYYYNGWQDATYSQRASALEYARVRFFPCTEHSYSNGRCTHCGKYQWYTVTYNGNGNTGGSVPTDNTHYPLDGTGTVTVRGNTGNLARTGYTFSGWNTQADGLGTDYAPGATFTINGATTLYAKWMPITYTVRFHKNHDDATGTMSDQAFTYDIAQKLTANAFTREGYQCLGWSTTTDGAVAYTNGQSVSNLATVQGTVVNLYAQWAMPYTITYDLAGGSVATPNPTNYTIESDAITLVNPTRDGYTFAGWTGTGLAGPTMTATIPKGSTGDRAYTATWTLNTYTITYDLAGGSVATPNPTTYNELSDAITLTNPTREGYTFAGWTGTDISGTAMTVTIPAGSSGNRSYTAHWLVNDSAYLAYNTTTGEFEPLAFPAGIVTSGTTTMGTANNESWYIVNENVSISDRITVNGTVHLILADGTTLTASKGITVNSGNTLNIYGQTSGTGTLNATGVQVNGSGTESAAIGSTNGTTVGNITIHGGRITAEGASWSAGIGGGLYSGGGSVAIYGGTVNATGHDGTSEAIGHGSSTDFAVSKSLANGLCVKVNNNPTPVDYGLRVSFLGQKIVTVEPCTEHNLSNNVCTYCGLSSYGVTYNSNNATSGTVPTDATEYTSGRTVTVLGNTGDLVRTGYTFGGWNTQADGLGTNYAPGETFTITSPVTLYAKWEARQLELANNGDNSSAISEAAASGKYHNVTLAGCTLYTDGDWNTLCLPFSLASLTGTPLEGATVKTLESTDFNDGTLTMTFTDNQTSIEAGKPYIVKWTKADLVIRTASEWNTFAQNVTNGTDDYQGKVVKLAADISVTTMVGTDGKEFKGTFDGCGHTLNVTLTGSAYYVAPFSYVNGCTIKNLIVTGTVNGGMHCSGLVGGGGGSINSSLIENCDVRVAVKCNQGSKKTHCGGFIGHSLSGSFTFRNCKFSGSISGAKTYTGVFMGWAGQPATHINCLAAGTYSYGGTLVISKGTNTYNNCYTTRSIGSDFTYTTETGSDLLALLGSGWEISNGQVVPKMADNIVNPVFSNVLISDATANISTDHANFIGSYAPITDTDLLLDAHNPNGDAMHAAISITQPSKTGYTFGGWYTDAALTTPATAIPFTTNGNVTLYAKWLVEELELVNNGDNSDAISTAAASGLYHNVTLADRTIYKDGDWNTLCLPFNLGNAEAEAGHHFDGTPLEGAVVKELNASTSILTANGTLTLNFTDADAIEAGKPYIVKWENASGSVSNPVFTGVTISSTTPTPVEFSITNSDDKCEFVGQYSPFSIVTSDATGDDEGNLNEIIMLSSGSRLGYSKNPRTLNTFRCHFYVPAKDGVQQARAFVMDFGDGETTGILPIDHSPLTIEHTADAWYTIDGMKLDNVPTKKGVYIVNGKKVKR